MIGAIIGDIVGSKYEYNNYKAKDFEFFDLNECGVTDDSVMSLAVAQGILDSDETGEEIHKAIIRNMKKLGQQYPDADYGPHFIQWVLGEVEEKPYGSTGNGSAMRVSACGFRANSLEEAKELAKASAEVTHNSPGGIRGAEATAAAIYLARTGATKDEIIREIKDNYYDYDFGGEFTVDNEREDYYYHLSCDGTVPYAIAAFVDGNDYEDGATRSWVKSSGTK